MTEINNARGGLLGRVVSLDEVRAYNESIDSNTRYNYKVNYKYSSNTLPDRINEERFNKCECNNEKEVAILQNAVKCLKAMWLGRSIPLNAEEISFLDEYANDTLLTFDYDTGKILFDEKAFEKDSNEYKNKQRTLIAEYNKIVASSTLLNAIENAKKLQQIKDKIAELQASQPDKSDAKYNHHEIVKGSISVKQALDRYKELWELLDKCEQEWNQYELNYKRSRAKKLNISEDTFKVFKELHKEGVFRDAPDKLCAAASRYENVKDYNENNWKEVSFSDVNDEGKKFLTQKQFKLWQKYGRYVEYFYEPQIRAWMMYDHFNDTDLMWLNALKVFNERVTALKRIEEQHTDACEQHTNACEQSK